MLPEDLIERLRARAADPVNRSDAAAAAHETLQDRDRPGPKPVRLQVGKTTGNPALGGLMQAVAGALASGRGIDPKGIANQVAQDVRCGKISLEDAMGDIPPGAGLLLCGEPEPEDGPRDLGQSASTEEISAMESTLGFPLPDDLKQIYAMVGNGGFGPGDGFPSISELAGRYQDFCANSQGPNDEDWPKHLLPLITADICEDCYDLGTGRIVRWDPEELLDEDAPHLAWERSFAPLADNLAIWLENWLAQVPLGERLAAQYENAALDNARRALEICREMPAGKRAELGLPEDGWEVQLCRNHGVDPKKLL